LETIQRLAGRLCNSLRAKRKRVVNSIRLRRAALPSTPTGRALLGARIALGISTLLAPRLAGRAFLLDPDANPQLPVIGRMWGIRNLSLAAGMYAATGANRRQWWRLQPAVDTLDFLAITTEWRRGAVPGPAAGLMAATALAAATLGALSVTASQSNPASSGTRVRIRLSSLSRIAAAPRC
jgi:hypothetical protein